MRSPSGAEFIDYYGLLEVEFDTERASIRKAFRARLLEAHPDKSAVPTDGARLTLVMRAWEILGDEELRESYDRIWLLHHRGEELDEASRLPHVTESARPQNRARSILFLLLEERGDEALERLRGLGPDAAEFLAEHLDSDKFVDASFLIAERFEGRKRWFEALEWYEHLLGAEARRRRHRPCYPEALDRTRKLLIRRTQDELEPRVALEYLRRAESLGLNRPQRAEVAKRRATAYVRMGMQVEAERQLAIAIDLVPGGKGLSRLREEVLGTSAEDDAGENAEDVGGDLAGDAEGTGGEPDSARG